MRQKRWGKQSGANAAPFRCGCKEFCVLILFESHSILRGNFCYNKELETIEFSCHKYASKPIEINR